MTGRGYRTEQTKEMQLVCTWGHIPASAQGWQEKPWEGAEGQRQHGAPSVLNSSLKLTLVGLCTQQPEFSVLTGGHRWVEESTSVGFGYGPVSPSPKWMTSTDCKLINFCIQTKKKIILPNLSRLFSHSCGNVTTFYLSPVQSSHDITWYSQHWFSLKNLPAFKDRQGNICGTKTVKYVQLFYNLGGKYPLLLRKMQKCGLIIPKLN